MAVSLEGRSRGGRPYGRRTRMMADINVTPMVDVMLVLLVIFMITAPLLTTGVTVDLPKADAKPLPEDDKPLAISIDRSGKIFLQEAAVELTDLAARVSAVSGSNPDVRLFVRGDQTIAYGRVMEVMGILHAAGFRKVALVTEPVGSAPATRGNGRTAQR